VWLTSACDDNTTSDEATVEEGSAVDGGEHSRQSESESKPDKTRSSDAGEPAQEEQRQAKMRDTSPPFNADEADGGADAMSGDALAEVEGPIPVTQDSGEPFRGANAQPVPGPGLPPPELEPFAYVEEEYFVSGVVAGEPYSTTLLVRKPRDAAAFSGLVAVETVHAQGAIPLWGSREVWLKGGHAWVGVASQLVALESQVKPANPERYARLSVPAVEDPAAQSMMQLLEGGPQDDLSQQIMAQVPLPSWKTSVSADRQLRVLQEAR